MIDDSNTAVLEDERSSPPAGFTEQVMQGRHDQPPAGFDEVVSAKRPSRDHSKPPAGFTEVVDARQGNDTSEATFAAGKDKVAKQSIDAAIKGPSSPYQDHSFPTAPHSDKPLSLGEQEFNRNLGSGSEFAPVGKSLPPRPRDEFDSAAKSIPRVVSTQDKIELESQPDRAELVAAKPVRLSSAQSPAPSVSDVQAIDPDVYTRAIRGANPNTDNEMPGSFEGHPENLAGWVEEGPIKAGRGVGRVAANVSPSGFITNPDEVATGASEVMQGGGMALAPTVPFSFAAAPLTVAAGFGAGYGASKVAEKGLEHTDLSPAEKQAIVDAAWFVPGAMAHISGFKAGKLNLEGPETELGARVVGRSGAGDVIKPGDVIPGEQLGSARTAEAFGGRVKGAVIDTPQSRTVAGRVGPFSASRTFAKSTGEPTPAAGLPPEALPPSPKPAETNAAIASMARAQAAEAMGTRIANGEPVAPPVAPAAAPAKSPISGGEVSPKLIDAIATAIQSAPPEARPQAMLEAHEKMTQALLQQGRVIGPDGQIHVVDSEKAASSLAQKWMNDQVAKMDRAQAEQAAMQSRENPPVAAAVSNPRGLIAKLKTALQEGARRQQEQSSIQETRTAATQKMKALASGDVDAVFIPKAGPVKPEAPEGFGRADVSTPDGPGVVYFNPQSYTAKDVKAAYREGTQQELLGPAKVRIHAVSETPEVISKPGQIVSPRRQEFSKPLTNKELDRIETATGRPYRDGDETSFQKTRLGTTHEIEGKAVPVKEFITASKKAAFKKGDAVSFADNEGIQRTGTLKHINDLAARITDNNGKTFEVAPSKLTTPDAKEIAGETGRMRPLVTPQREIKSHYRIVEADHLTPSHNPESFAPNVKYPAGVQERTYHTSKEAQSRVIQQAQNLKPALLINTNPDSVNGPPVMTPDGIVLGGNSRTMTIQRVYKQGGGDRYKAALRKYADDFGFTPEQVDKFKNPVLVRQVEQPKDLDDTRRLGSELNKSMTGALGVSERAVSAGKSVKPETLAEFGDMMDSLGPDTTLRELMAKRGPEIVKALVRDGVITERERPQFVDTSNGGLSEEGKAFVERALMGSVIDDPTLMERTPKGVLAKLDGSLGDLSLLNGRSDEYNILPALRVALEKHADIAQRGTTVDLYLKQKGMFGDDRNPIVDALVQVLDAKPRQVKDALRQFTQDAKYDIEGQRTLSMGVEPDAASAFNAAFNTDLSPAQFETSLKESGEKSAVLYRAAPLREALSQQVQSNPSVWRRFKDALTKDVLENGHELEGDRVSDGGARWAFNGWLDKYVRGELPEKFESLMDDMLAETNWEDLAKYMDETSPLPQAMREVNWREYDPNQEWMRDYDDRLDKEREDTGLYRAEHLHDRRFQSIKIEEAPAQGGLFGNDTTMYRVSATDENGEVARYLVSEPELEILKKNPSFRSAMNGDSQGSLFRRSTFGDQKMWDAARESLNDMAFDTHEDSGQEFLSLNAAAQRVVSAVLGSNMWYGVSMPATEAHNLATYLRVMFLRNDEIKLEPSASAALSDLCSKIDDATNHNGNAGLIFVQKQADDSRFEHVVNHELIHGWQRSLTSGSVAFHVDTGAMMDTAAVRSAIPELKNMGGYDVDLPEVVVSEVAAYIINGERDELKINASDANDFIDKYVDLLWAQHGTHTIKAFPGVNTPEAQKFKEEVQNVATKGQELAGNRSDRVEDAAATRRGREIQSTAGSDRKGRGGFPSESIEGQGQREPQRLAGAGKPVHQSLFRHADKPRIDELANLSPEHESVQRDVIAHTKTNFPKLVDDYIARNSEHGRVNIVSDAAKDLLPHYQTIEQRQANSEIAHPSSAAIAEGVWRKALAQPVNPERPEVLFLTGIQGAGKSSSFTGIDVRNVGILYERSLANQQTAERFINEAIASGRRPVIAVVYTDDPAVALERAVGRAKQIGRTVNIRSMSEIYAGVAKTVPALKQKYGDALAVRVINNSGPVPVAESLDSLERISNNWSEAKTYDRLSTELTRLRENGQASEGLERAFRFEAAGRRGNGDLAGPGKGTEPQTTTGNEVTPSKKTGESGFAKADIPIALAEGLGRAASAVRTLIESEADKVRISRDLQAGIYELESRFNANVLRATQLLKHLPASAKDEEAIYHAREDSRVKLTPEQEELKEKWSDPLRADAERAYVKVSQGGMPIEGYVHRQLKDSGGLIDRLMAGKRGGAGGGNVLSKSAPSLKKRTMMALEDKSGARKLVSIKDGRIRELRDNSVHDIGSTRSVKTAQSILDKRVAPIDKKLEDLKKELTFEKDEKAKRQLSHEIAYLTNQREKVMSEAGESDLNNSIFTDKQGKEWKLAQATTKEIEGKTDLRYYHNDFASSLINWLNMRRAEDAFDFLEAFKKSPEFPTIAVNRDDVGNPPEGWKPTKLQQFSQYYFEPHTAEVLDWFADKLTHRPDLYDRISRVLQTSIFYNPLWHSLNVGVHWTVEKGVSGWAVPTHWPTMLRAGMRATRAVVSMDKDFLAMLDAGAPLQSQRFETDQFSKLFYEKMAKELEEDPAIAEQVAKAIGMAVPRLIKLVYRGASRSMWALNDVLFMQATYEKMARGVDRDTALRETGKHIPDYRLPTRIFNSPGLGKLMNNRTVSMFSPYHYGLLRSYGEMMKSIMGANGPDDGEQTNDAGRTAAQERLHGIDVAAMLALTVCVLYPAVDALLKRLTRDKHAEWRRAGAASFPYALWEMAKGEKSPTQVAESVVTPAILAKGAAELAVNRDFYSGRKVYDTHAPAGTIAKQVGGKVASMVAPVGAAMRASRSEGDMRKVLYGMAGISFPLHGAERIAADIAIGKMSSEAPDPDAVAHRIMKHDLLDAARAGNYSKLEKAEQTGQITTKEARTLRREAIEEPLLITVKSFTAEEVLRVYEAGNPQQKALLEPILQKKLIKLRSTNPHEAEQIDQEVAK